MPVIAFERAKNVPPQGTQFWNRRVIEIAAVDHSDLFHDSPRTSVRLHGECEHGVNPQFIDLSITYRRSQGLLTPLNACNFVQPRVGLRVGTQTLYPLH